MPNISSNSFADRLECIDTSSNPESCGGCLYPKAGQQEGEDCTAIPNVADVRCYSGSCVVNACVRGYTLSDGECVSKKGDLGEILGAALRQGIKHELVFAPTKRRVQPRTSNKNRRDVL